MESYQLNVFSIADELQKEFGRFPTNNEIRNRLGGGSMSTIAPILRAWRESKISVKEQESAIIVPEEVLDIMNRHNVAVWDAANQNALKMISAIKEDHELKISAVNEELSTSYADYDVLAKERDDLRLEIEKLHSDLQEAQLDRDQAILGKEVAESTNNQLVDEIKTSRDEIKAERDLAIKKYDDLVEHLKDSQKSEIPRIKF